MSLSSDTKLGPYEIQSPLGAGGMGEVYLATQTNLARPVAIKVLSSVFVSDTERLRRFEQEARAASALNHPNIISIYDVGRENDIAYIAMEFVDGRTLRVLLESGPLSIRKALQLACQVADGLAKAHSAGIVHRDLKPENIMVAKDGFVKLLDFGLAKLMPRAESSSNTRTATVWDSHPGAILGTAGYMSPEQARGAELDYRSDIFSLGLILYELVTGTAPFRRDSTAQTLAAIIEDELPPLTDANCKAPMPLRWVIERCLAKDPEERYSSTLDLARDLKNIRDHLSDTAISGSTSPVVRAKPSKWIIPAMFAIAGLVLGAILMAVLRPEATISIPSVRPITFSGNDFSPSVSPDGRTIAFVSAREGVFQIWLKQIATGSETVLTQGPDDILPHFSPDGAWVMFIHNRAAYRIPSIGGEPRKLLDNIDDAGWSPDGRQIAFVRFENAGTKIGIASVPEGRSQIIHAVDNLFLRSPSWSPDGTAIALVPRTSGTVGSLHGLFLISPDGGNARAVKCPLSGGELSAPAWLGGHRKIIYALPESQGDVGILQASIIGSAGRVLLQDVESGKFQTLFTISGPTSRVEIAGTGRAVFDSLAQPSNLKLYTNTQSAQPGSHWLTRGKSVDRQPFFSPDGTSVIFSSSRAGDVDLWEVSLKTDALRRLTDDPALDWDPFITRDNQHLVWSSNRSGNFEIWVADRDGSSPHQVSHDGFDAENPVVSSDGWVFYISGQPKQPGLWKVRLDGVDPTLLVPGPAAWPDVSPDGKYVLYHTVADGLHGYIHVVHTADGTPVDFHALGQRARFSTDGRSIVYIQAGGRDIVRQDFLSAGNSPHPLVLALPDFLTETFEISPDGSSVVASYTQPSRSLMLADGVAGIDLPKVSQ